MFRTVFEKKNTSFVFEMPSYKVSNGNHSSSLSLIISQSLKEEEEIGRGSEEVCSVDEGHARETKMQSIVVVQYKEDYTHDMRRKNTCLLASFFLKLTHAKANHGGHHSL